MTTALFHRAFLLLCLAALFFFASNHLLTPLLPLYFQSLQISGESLGALLAGFMAASMLIRPWVGRWADRGSKLRLMIIGLALFALCPWLYTLGPFSGATGLVWLWLVRIAHGVSFALMYTASASFLVTLVPDSRRAEGISHYSNAIKVAMAFSPPLALWLTQSQHWSLPQTIAVASGFALLSLLCVLALLRQTPTGDASATPAKPGPGNWLAWPAVYPGAVMASNSLAFGALIPFVPMIALDKHLAEPGWFYTVYAVFLIASRGLTGAWSDRSRTDSGGRERVLIPGMLAVSVSLVLLCHAPDQALFLVAAGLYGLAAGTVQPSLMAMAAERVDKTRTGSAMATFTFLNDSGIALGTWLMASLGARYGYADSLIWIALGTGLGWLSLTLPVLGKMLAKSKPAALSPGEAA